MNDNEQSGFEITIDKLAGYLFGFLFLVGLWNAIEEKSFSNFFFSFIFLIFALMVLPIWKEKKKRVVEKYISPIIQGVLVVLMFVFFIALAFGTLVAFIWLIKKIWYSV